MPDGAIGGLAEVAALGVLHVGAAGEDADAHIGDGGAGEDADVLLLHQVGEDEPLPVQVQHVLTAQAAKDQPAALGQRFQQQVYLGVVAQRFKVPHALHRGGDGLLI